MIRPIFKNYIRLMMGRDLVGVRRDATVDESDMKKVIQKFARGSTALQAPALRTEAEMKRDKEEIADFSFCN